MTMHTERLAASVMDMWYGSRDAWFERGLPYTMNLVNSEPAYRDHLCLEYIAEYGQQPEDAMDWIDSDRMFHDCVAANNRDGASDPLGDWHGRNE